MTATPETAPSSPGPWPARPVDPPPGPRVPHQGTTGAIVIALAMSAAWGVGQILFWAQPDIVSPLPWMKIFLLPEPTPFKVLRILLPVGWGLAAALALLLFLRTRTAGAAPGGARVRGVRACRLGILGALLLPYAVLPLDTFINAPLTLLLCLPTTLAVLLCLHRVQLYRRIPGWLLLAAFGWGVLIGGGFGIGMITWFQRYAGGYLLDFQHPRDCIRDLYQLLSLNAALVTELGKAAGVAVLFLLFRRHFDGVVSGVVIGAAVGLGFNLVETVLYMDLIAPHQQPAQFWSRQVVGLLAVHVAFSALAGAGFGAARWLPERRDRLLVVLCGVLAAMGGHFETDSVLPQLAKSTQKWFSSHQALGLLLGVPLMTAITSGVFVVLYVLILRRGLRAQAQGLSHALEAEAGNASRAVTAPEVGLLLSPRRRLLLELRVWRRDGTAGVRHLMRLHQAQLDLATQQWHRTRPGADALIPDERHLRELVLALKSPAVTGNPPAFPPPQEALS
ncbi:PrsW family glutamic-type intramembrane protease [Streptomyces roseus]|uniref:PrsW family glutamic-type intramembrane protease n=1 Tax=Streptomyces roseus TaxID=66430 RepID=UPI00369CA3B2